MDARPSPSISRPHPSRQGTAWPLHHKRSCSTLKTFPRPPSTHLCSATTFPTFQANCPPALLPLAAVTLGDPSHLPSPLCLTTATVPAGWLQGGGGRLCPPALRCLPTAAAPGQCPSWEPPSLCRHLQAWPLDGFSPKTCPFSSHPPQGRAACLDLGAQHRHPGLILLS